MSLRRWMPIAGAAALTAVSLFAVWDHTRIDSLSADEPIHILGGYLQAAGQNAIVNIEHPPLMKELAGLALLFLPLPPPPEQVPMGNRFIDYGHAFLFGSPVPVDRIVAAARAPFLLVFALLLLGVFVAARSRYGSLAALFAFALVALDPNFVAHAGVVHTDLGAAAAFLLVVLAWDRARDGGWGSLVIAGLALGLALLTKFSCIYLVPILLLQTLLAARETQRPGQALARGLGRLALAGVFAGIVVWAGYVAVTSRMDRAAQRQIIHEMVALRGAPGLSAEIERIASLSPPLGHYLGGLASVYRQNAEGGGVNFLFGRVSVHGFASYFFVAFLVKSTLAFLAVTLLVAAACVKDRRARAEARLWLIPVAILFLASLGASYNIGIRHMLPVYPFLALAGAGALGRLRESGNRAALILLAALPLLSAVELARIHPHELSYFNPLAGGPVEGRGILSDSNVDWGLDLKRLAAELSRRRVANPTVVYFGGDDVFERIGVPDFSADPRVRGRLIAISAFHWAEGPAFYAYHGASGVAASLARLRRELQTRGRRIGRVGYSIDLYDLPPEEAHAR
ncbi:MAG TPA: glycosyltransferase family 39 protein [Thermoanaerobaculia bacterium]|nr:glycosyltransferase family 39 protein [Thermoanaerobaculia bacterium]